MREEMVVLVQYTGVEKRESPRYIVVHQSEETNDGEERHEGKSSVVFL